MQRALLVIDMEQFLKPVRRTLFTEFVTEYIGMEM